MGLQCNGTDLETIEIIEMIRHMIFKKKLLLRLNFKIQKSHIELQM